MIDRMDMELPPSPRNDAALEDSQEKLRTLQHTHSQVERDLLQATQTEQEAQALYDEAELLGTERDRQQARDRLNEARACKEECKERLASLARVQERAHEILNAQEKAARHRIAPQWCEAFNELVAELGGILLHANDVNNRLKLLHARSQSEFPQRGDLRYHARVSGGLPKMHWDDLLLDGRNGRLERWLAEAREFGIDI